MRELHELTTHVKILYKALYPSEIAENNIAPNTMYGKVFFPEQLDPKENRFNNDTFDRTVWFIEDLVSNDRINFCNRYLNLAGYEQMYDDIIEYFNTVKNPFNGLRMTRLECNIEMSRNVIKDQKREMIRYVDNSIKYSNQMIINQERMVNCGFNSSGFNIYKLCS